MNIGDRISSLRIANGLSQEAFADRLGVSRQAVSKWETGASVPETDKILLMSELFGVSTDALLKGEGPSESPAVSAEEPTAELPPLPEIPADEAAPAFRLDDPGEAELPAPEEEAVPAWELPAESAAEPPAGDGEDNPPKKRHLAAKLIAVVLVLCLIAGAVLLPLHYGGVKEAWWALCGGKISYPYVLVHGLGGWGEDSPLNEHAPYWGASTGSLPDRLRAAGCTVVAPSVGPVSSAWDRACELYAQLTGTTVDYGQAHADAHNHARFGRSYDTPLIENWGEKINGGQRVKIHLIGHSFGGATVRLLTWLLANGSAEEIAATGNETSPLFTGKKGDWVCSVTALCAPHNGSSLVTAMDTLGSIVGLGDSTQLLAYLIFAAAGIATPIASTYDFMLDQFGISPVEGTVGSVRGALDALMAKGTDHAGYDLSPDGAMELNGRIGTVDSVYYFSYPYCTTHAGTLLPVQVPNTNTLPVLIPTATAMGMFQGTTKGGIQIGTDWQPNDGLVSVVSAACPATERSSPFPADPTDGKAYAHGVWYVAETREGDHGTVIGLNADVENTMQFWNALIAQIDGLHRD